MGFKTNITAYKEMLTEYERRGDAMRAAQYERTLSAPARPAEATADPWEGYDAWGYACEPLGCDGMTCGH